MTSRPLTRPTGLARLLGVGDLALIVVGAVIGSGIFLVPAPVLRDVGGSVPLAFVVWTLGGVLSVLGALTYGELGASRPEAGGLYVYIRDGFGPYLAFIYGWALFFMIGSGSVATLAVAFASYLGEIVEVPPLATPLVAGAAIVVTAILNIRGTRRSADVQNVAALIKSGAVVAVSILLLAAARSPAVVLAEATSTTNHGVSLSGIGIAVVAVLWAYEGWQYVTFSAGEAKDPQRTFPRGIVTGTVVVVLIYLLANLAYVRVLGAQRAAASPRIAAEAVGVVFGPVASKVIAGAILISMFSAAHAITLTSTRVFYAMARDGVFFRSLGTIHPRFGTPAVAVAAFSGWGIVLAASGTFEQLLTYVVFTGWIFFALGAASLIIDRRKRPDAHRPFQVPGYPWTPLLFVIAAALIVVSTLAGQPRRAAVGLLIVATAVPAYWIWRRPTHRSSTGGESS